MIISLKNRRKEEKNNRIIEEQKNWRTEADGVNFGYASDENEDDELEDKDNNAIAIEDENDNAEEISNSMRRNRMPANCELRSRINPALTDTSRSSLLSVKSIGIQAFEFKPDDYSQQWRNCRGVKVKRRRLERWLCCAVTMEMEGKSKKFNNFIKNIDSILNMSLVEEVDIEEKTEKLLKEK